jgi:vanillate O-demethylase ferredoxin subunit
MARHIELRVAEARPAGPGIRRLTLRDPDGWPLPRVRPGAHLDLHVPGVGPRAYSLCGDPSVQDAWTVAVKLEAESRGGSTWVHGLREGDPVAASMPRCTFPLAEGATRHVMIAGGIGVTPFLAMAPVLERTGADWTLHLLHRGALPCPDELARWLASGHAVAHDTAVMPRPSLDALLGPRQPGLQAYCCGPLAMIDAFEQATAAWPSGTARAEHFVPPILAPDPSARPYTLVLAGSGAAADVAAGGSMLAALRALGTKMEASCEGGICGACKMRWLEGEPIHRDRVLTPEERQTHLMACVAGCASERLVLEA